MNSRCLWLLLMFLCCSALHAGPTPWVTEQATALSWKAVEDDNGGFYVLWTHQEGSGFRLLGQHITATGTPLWTAPGQTFLPVLADTGSWTAFSDSNKGIALAWLEDHKVRAQRWTANGQPLWKLPANVSDARYIAANPTGVADGAGGIYLVWDEKMYTDRSVLMSQHLNAQAVPVWPVAIRVSLRPSDQRQPMVAFDGAAGIIVSWADYRDFASDWRVQRINFQGFRLWGLEGIEMAAPAGTGNSGLRIAPWGQGSLTVAWVDSQNGHSRVQDRQINPKGNPIPKEDHRLSAAPSDQWNPVLTGDGQGHYWVGWEDNRNDENWKIYLRQNDSAEIALSTLTSGDQGRLALSEDGAQGVYAAWFERRKGAPSLFAQRLDADAQPFWETGGREIASNVTHPETPRLLTLDASHAALLWVDQPTNGHYALYWRILAP